MCGVLRCQSNSIDSGSRYHYHTSKQQVGLVLEDFEFASDFARTIGRPLDAYSPLCRGVIPLRTDHLVAKLDVLLEPIGRHDVLQIGENFRAWGVECRPLSVREEGVLVLES